MGDTTAINQLRHPLPGEPATIAAYFEDLADDVDVKLDAVFTSTAARDATITNPVRGMACKVTPSNGAITIKYVYNGTSWFEAWRSTPGWVTPASMLNGWTVGGSPRGEFQYRVKDDHLELRGVPYNSGGISTSWTAMMPANAALSPYGKSGSNAHYFVATCGNGTFSETLITLQCQVRPDGAFWVKAASGSQNLAYLDGYRWPKA